MPGDEPRTLRFGDFEIHPIGRQLLQQGRALAVGPRAFDVLLALVERAGHLVTKAELLDRVWPRLVVEENNLQVQVSALRKLLGARMIETVAGSGYRFTGAVTNATAPAVPAPSSRNNLPQQLTSFVGREGELADLRRLLAKTALLTVIGVGGLGKTRVALRVAAEVLPEYPDGVWFVDFAPLADPSMVPQAIASALGALQDAQRPILETLTGHVARTRMLIVLNNCEHLLLPCAAVARHLLHAAADLQILATSREALHVLGETTYRLSPLSVPQAEHVLPLEELMRFESARLFVDRAVDVHPAYVPGARDAPALAEICRRLDGIPLALELAAARVRVLPVEAIAQRLHDRFALLKGGDRTALPRQQTLRAMIDWSYELLAAKERMLLCRLAVFAGGFTLEAAEAVGNGEEIAAREILDLLGNLVDKSLLARDAAADSYRMLETIREYASAHLVDAGGEHDARTRHLRYYVALAQRADAAHAGPEQDAWNARLDGELENILAAHAWCDRAHDGAEAGLMLVAAMRVWFSRSALELGRRVTLEALARPALRTRTRARCHAAYAAATLCFFIGRYDEAREMGLESLAIAREVGDTLKTVDALVVLGVAWLAKADRTSARPYLVEALAVARQASDPTRLGDALNNLAEVYCADGDIQAAVPLYEEALANARASGYRHAIVVFLLNLTRTSIELGLRERAIGQLREVIAHIDPHHSGQGGQQLLVIGAGLAVLQEDWTRAARLYGAAEAEVREQSSPREPLESAFLAPRIERARAALGAGAFAAAEAAGGALTYGRAVAEIDAWIERSPH